jgi:hypothetical protein
MLVPVAPEHILQKRRYVLFGPILGRFALRALGDWRLLILPNDSLNVGRNPTTQRVECLLGSRMLNPSLNRSSRMLGLGLLLEQEQPPGCHLRRSRRPGVPQRPQARQVRFSGPSERPPVHCG